jgi:hypothetical protein
MVEAKADYVKFHNSSVRAMWMDWTFTSTQCCTWVGKYMHPIGSLVQTTHREAYKMETLEGAPTIT